MTELCLVNLQKLSQKSRLLCWYVDGFMLAESTHSHLRPEILLHARSDRSEIARSPKQCAHCYAPMRFQGCQLCQRHCVQVRSDLIGRHQKFCRKLVGFSFHSVSWESMHHDMSHLMRESPSQAISRNARVHHKNWRHSRQPLAQGVDSVCAKVFPENNPARIFDKANDALNRAGRNMPYCAESLSDSARILFVLFDVEILKRVFVFACNSREQLLDVNASDIQ